MMEKIFGPESQHFNPCSQSFRDVGITKVNNL